MKPYCETVVQVVLPTIRALIAKDLIEKYKFTQQDAASKLGLTQSAISQYLRNLRGSKIKILEKDKEINKQIEKFASRIASGELNSSNTLIPFCNICKNIRKSKILCKIHKKAFPELENCNICFD
jgi:predicted transcriptional regulator